MPTPIRLGLDIAPTFGGCTVFQLSQERIEYVQPPGWHQLLFHRFPAVIRINGREYQQPKDGVAIVPPRAVFSIRRSAEPGTLFQMYFQPSAEASYPLLFDPVFEAGELADGLDLLLRRAFDRLMVMRPHLNTAIWTVLCHFGRVPTESERPADVQRVELYVDDHLSDSFTMAELAERVGVSHSTLIRLAKEHWGMTPLDYVRSRKMERAAQLLVGSSMSIKQVAIAVGIPDLHRFNKTIRSTFMVSPRKLRETAPFVDLNEQRRLL